MWKKRSTKMKSSILMKLVRFTAIFILTFVLTEGQVLSMTANSKKDCHIQSVNVASGSANITVCVTYSDRNNDGIYDHATVWAKVNYDRPTVGSGEWSGNVYDGSFMMRNGDGNGQFNNEPLLYPSIKDSLIAFSILPEFDPNNPNQFFNPTSMSFTYADVTTLEITGQYNKYAADPIPLYESFKSAEKKSVDESLKDLASLFVKVLQSDWTIPIQIYPNPVNTNITVSLGTEDIKSDDVVKFFNQNNITSLDFVKIYNEKGELVWESNGTIDLNKLPYNIKVNNLTNGTYFLETHAGKWKGTKNFIVAK